MTVPKTPSDLLPRQELPSRPARRQRFRHGTPSILKDLRVICPDSGPMLRVRPETVNAMSVLGDTLENFGRDKYDFTDAEQPKYTDEYVARMVGEGTNKLLGRAEYLSLPMIYAGYTALIVGPTQSVYEAPEYRELYKHGETTDTFTRRMIKATEVPGNFNPKTGKYVKPYIVGTSDDIMRHYAPIKADGTPAARITKNPPVRDQTISISVKRSSTSPMSLRSYRAARNIR